MSQKILGPLLFGSMHILNLGFPKWGTCASPRLQLKVARCYDSSTLSLTLGSLGYFKDSNHSDPLDPRGPSVLRIWVPV